MPSEEIVALLYQIESRLDELQSRIDGLENLRVLDMENAAINGDGGDSIGVHEDLTDEQVAVLGGCCPGYLGSTEADGVIQSSDGSITMLAVDPGDGTPPYKDLTVAPGPGNVRLPYDIVG
jgi:hypothetical protein